MKKMRILALGLLFALFALPAFASGKTGSKTAQNYIAGSATLAAILGVATLKKSDGSEFSTEEKELLNGIQSLLDSVGKEAITKEQLEEELKKLQPQITQESFDELKNAINEQTKEINALKEKGDMRQEIKKATIMSKLNEILTDKAQLDALASFKSNKNGEFKIVIKAAEIMTVASTAVYNRDNQEEWEVSPREEIRISNFVNRQPAGSVDSPSYSYLEKYDEQGNAAITAQGVLKPLRSWKTRRITEDPKKIAVRSRMSDENLLFVPGMMQYLREDVISELMDALDDHIVSEISTDASTYSLTTIATTDPNYYDALRAAIAQVRSFKYQADTVFVNPIDACNMELTKGSDGHYIYVTTPGANGQFTINRLRVIETTQIDVGKFIVGDLTKYKLRDVTNIIIRFVYSSYNDGSNEDDAAQNLVTVIGEQYVNSWMSQIHSTAFVEDTFANVIGAL